MKEIIKETKYSYGGNTYIIRVFFDGKDYSACCYLNEEPLTDTILPGDVVKNNLNAESPEIENLIYLLKEDINDRLKEGE